MLHIKKRGQIYHAVGRVRGKLIRESLHTRSLAIAQTRVRALEEELYSGKVRVLHKSWPDYAQEFTDALHPPAVKAGTAQKYRFVIDRFSRFLEDRGVRYMQLITPELIEQYEKERALDIHPFHQTRCGPGGIKSDLRILRRAFNKAVESRHMDKNPIAKRNLNSVPAGTLPFSDEEVDAMLTACAERAGHGQGTPIDLSAIVWLFLNTGLRISDVIHFPKSAIRGGWIYLRTRKRDTPVAIPVHPRLGEALERWNESQSGVQRASPYLFSTRTGGPLKLDRMLRGMWKYARIAGAHAHRFRDTFAVGLLRQGASLHDVAEALGISDAVCARHYAPFSEELRKRVQRFVFGLFPDKSEQVA